MVRLKDDLLNQHDNTPSLGFHVLLAHLWVAAMQMLQIYCTADRIQNTQSDSYFTVGKWLSSAYEIKALPWDQGLSRFMPH